MSKKQIWLTPEQCDLALRTIEYVRGDIKHRITQDRTITAPIKIDIYAMRWADAELDRLREKIMGDA